MSAPRLRPGDHLRAGATVYRIAALDDDCAIVAIVAGATALVGRPFRWPLANLLANLDLGIVRAVPPPDDAPEQPRLLP